MRHGLTLLLCLLLSRPACAQLSGEFRALTLKVPPLSVSVDPQRKEMQGYLGEVFIGAMRQAGLLEHISVGMIPWKRAQLYALSQKNIVLFPLSRTPVRETQYHWLARVLEESCYIWNLAPAPVIDSFEALRQVGKIGGQAGATQTTELRRMLGPVDGLLVEDSETEELALRKLLAGHVQAWSAHSINANFVARQLAEAEHLSPIKLQRGVKLFDADTWIAVSKDTAESDAIQLQQALERFMLSEEYLAINRKYHINGRRYQAPE
jgi:polar amino acid transport system substrate-binding protein